VIARPNGVTQSGWTTNVRFNCSDGYFFAHRILLATSPLLGALFYGVGDSTLLTLPAAVVNGLSIFLFYLFIFSAGG